MPSQRLRALGDFVRHIVVTDMPPPDQRVGLGQQFLRQAVFRLIESRRADIGQAMLDKARAYRVS
jgi:hypothetical protein